MASASDRPKIQKIIDDAYEQGIIDHKPPIVNSRTFDAMATSKVALPSRSGDMSTDNGVPVDVQTVVDSVPDESDKNFLLGAYTKITSGDMSGFDNQDDYINYALEQANALSPQMGDAMADVINAAQDHINGGVTYSANLPGQAEFDALVDGQENANDDNLFVNLATQIQSFVDTHNKLPPASTLQTLGSLATSYGKASEFEAFVAALENEAKQSVPATGPGSLANVAAALPTKEPIA